MNEGTFRNVNGRRPRSELWAAGFTLRAQVHRLHVREKKSEARKRNNSSVPGINSIYV